MIDQNITISNWWLFGAADLSVSRSRLCVVFEYLPKTNQKKWAFYVIQKLSRFKIEWHFFGVLFHSSTLFIASHHHTHTIVVCECITIVKSVLHPFEFLFYDQTYFISNWLFTSNTSCFVVGVFNRHRVILLPRKREKKTRAREIYNLKTKNIYIEININKIQ